MQIDGQSVKVTSHAVCNALQNNQCPQAIKCAIEDKLQESITRVKPDDSQRENPEPPKRRYPRSIRSNENIQ